MAVDFLREYRDTPLGGNYRLLERLGAGGMGEVYRARHLHLQSDCVIKVMRPQLGSDAMSTERFLREARAARTIRHPNVATLHELSILPDGSFYMVWELIEGQTLTSVLREQGPLDAASVIRVALQALHGLSAIHNAGFVHRDISPDNLMIANDVVKIIDLGIAKSQGDPSLTATGMFIGKLKYASPEQLGSLGDEEIDGRSDLYSLGIVMYEMLAGRAPFAASTPQQYMLKHLTEKPRTIGREPQLEAVIFRALAKDRNQRFENAEELAAALEAIDVVRATPEKITTTVELQAEAEPLPGGFWWALGTGLLFIVLLLVAIAYEYEPPATQADATYGTAPIAEPDTSALATDTMALSTDTSPPATDTSPPATVMSALATDTSATGAVLDTRPTRWINLGGTRPIPGIPPPSDVVTVLADGYQSAGLKNATIVMHWDRYVFVSGDFHGNPQRGDIMERTVSMMEAESRIQWIDLVLFDTEVPEEGGFEIHLTRSGIAELRAGNTHPDVYPIRYSLAIPPLAELPRAARDMYRGRTREALEQFRGGSDEDSAYGVVACLYWQGKYRETIEQVDHMLVAWPQSPDIPRAVLKRYYSYVALGDTAAAKRSIDLRFQKVMWPTDASRVLERINPGNW